MTINSAALLRFRLMVIQDVLETICSQIKLLIRIPISVTLRLNNLAKAFQT